MMTEPPPHQSTHNLNKLAQRAAAGRTPPVTQTNETHDSIRRRRERLLYRLSDCLLWSALGCQRVPLAILVLMHLIAIVGHRLHANMARIPAIATLLMHRDVRVRSYEVSVRKAAVHAKHAASRYLLTIGWCFNFRHVDPKCWAHTRSAKVSGEESERQCAVCSVMVTASRIVPCVLRGRVCLCVNVHMWKSFSRITYFVARAVTRTPPQTCACDPLILCVFR